MGNITIVAATKAPLSETLIFVAHHLNIGVDRIIIFFTDPNDPALSHLSNIEQVICIPCDRTYWKARGVESPQLLSFCTRNEISANFGLRMARELGDEWVMYLDHDELLYPDTASLRETLEQATCDIVRFELREAVAKQLDSPHIFSTDLFKILPSEQQLKFARWAQCQTVFYENEYFRGHRLSKFAFRTAAPVQWLTGHFVIASAGSDFLDDEKSLFEAFQARKQLAQYPRLPEEQTSAVKLLHYDSIGIQAWREKWESRMEVSGRIEQFRRNRKQQFQDFQTALSAGERELELLYRKLYMIPKYEEFVLKQLGMLTEIRLDPDSFQMPQMPTAVNAK